MSAISILFSRKLIVGLSLSALLTGCAPVAFQPPGPSVTVLPAPNKSFDVYRQDHATCKQFAAGEVDGVADQTNIRTLAEAGTDLVLGTVVGAAAGGGMGAGIGAASGLAAGAWFASNDTPWGVYGLQDRYNAAFIECMYAKGNQVPASGTHGYGYPEGWGTQMRYFGTYYGPNASVPTPYQPMMVNGSGG